MYRAVFWTVGEEEGGMSWGNVMETCIISYKKQIASPGSIQDPWGWCTGMTQRDGTGREVGGGFRMGNTWHIHVVVWQNQYNMVK